MSALRFMAVFLSAAAHVGLIAFLMMETRDITPTEAQAPMEVSLQDIPDKSDSVKTDSAIAVPVLPPEPPEQMARISEAPAAVLPKPDVSPMLQPSEPPETATEIIRPSPPPAAVKPNEPAAEQPVVPPPQPAQDPPLAPSEQPQPAPNPLLPVEEPAFVRPADPAPISSNNATTETELKTSEPSNPSPPKPAVSKNIAPEVRPQPIAPSTRPRSPPKPKMVAALPEPSHDPVGASKIPPPVQQSQNNQNIRAAFLASLSARLRSRMAFPAGAPAGLVVVHFAIDRTGSVVSRQVIKSSGSKQLDDAALDMVARAAPFPAIPEGLAGNRFDVTQPLNFHGH
jgi:periplasmic protein TonB